PAIYGDGDGAGPDLASGRRPDIHETVGDGARRILTSPPRAWSMRVMTKRWAGAIWGMLLLAGGAAHAERPKILVLPVAGKAAAPGFRERVAQALSEGVIASGGEVVAPPSGPAALPADGCTTSACLSAAARATGAALLLRASVEEEGRSYSFKLEMLDGQSGALLAQRENRCEICTDAEALEIANAAASAL